MYWIGNASIRFHFAKNRLIIVPLILCFVCSTTLSQNKYFDETETQNKRYSFDRLLDSLNELNASSYYKANEIRMFVAKNLNRGVPRDSISLLYDNLPYDSISPFECLQMLEQDLIKGNCGLASYLLAKLYDYGGFKSFIYDCGFEGTRYTHQFTLVETDGRLIVQDAHYNITFTDSNEIPKDFIQLLTELKTGDFRNIVIEQDEIIKTYWTDSYPDIDSLENIPGFDGTNAGNITDISAEGGSYKVTMKINFESIVKKRFSKMLPLMLQEGLPENFLSIYLKPLHIIDASDGTEAIELKKLIEDL